MSQQPCRQLNSAAIKGEVLANIIPLVRSSCSVIGVKCIWRVQGGEAGIHSAWKHIVSKRNECDTVIGETPGVAFYFSAISTYQQSKTSVQLELEQSLSGDEEDEPRADSQPLASSSQVSAALSKCGKTKLYPAITYWVAMQSANGAPVDALVLHSALVNCAVEVNSTRASTRRGGSEIVNKLCQLLKDHKNNFMCDLVRDSFDYCRKELFEKITGEPLDAEPLLKWDSVVRMVVVNRGFSASLPNAISRLTDVGLHYDVFYCDGFPENESIADPPKQLAEPLTVLCNDVERALNKLCYAYRAGDVYKRHPQSKFTYYRLCSMDSFLNSLLGNAYFKDRLLTHMPKLQAILKHPECQAIAQIDIDRDLVEVGQGWCWSFKRRQFVQHALEESQLGRLSARAFVQYEHTEENDPKFFKEIMTNSLVQADISALCEDFLKLFECHSREHKQKVPCLIGPSNSGKTSLFMATHNIIDVSKVAKVTKQKEFNKAMINETTELINLDEARVESMDIDDWKIITQGGWTAHDRKWKAAKGFINRAPIFITCQKDLDFGSPEDNQAMGNRLNKYHLTALTQVRKEAAKWIRDHPMNCIVWAAEQSEVLNNPRPNEDNDGNSEMVCDMGLSSNDKLAIISLNFGPDTQEPPNDMTSVINQDMPSSSDTDTSDEDEIIPLLSNAQNMYKGNVGIARMLDQLMLQLKEKNRRIKSSLVRMKEQQHETRRQHVRDMGVNEELIQLLPSSPRTSIPQQLQQVMMQKQAERKAAEEHKEDEVLESLFENTWLITKEKEMTAMQLEIQNCPKSSVRRAKEYLLGTKSDSLKIFHEKHKTHLTKGLKLRRKMCVAQGLLKNRDSHLVTTLHEPLPLIESDASTKEHQDESEEEEGTSTKKKTPSIDDSDQDDKKGKGSTKEHQDESEEEDFPAVKRTSTKRKVPSNDESSQDEREEEEGTSTKKKTPSTEHDKENGTGLFWNYFSFK